LDRKNGNSLLLKNFQFIPRDTQKLRLMFKKMNESDEKIKLQRNKAEKAVTGVDGGGVSSFK
jgi:hypothetical protein